MKRFLLVGIFAVAAFVGSAVATVHTNLPFASIPAPAATPTLAPPAATPTPQVASNPSTDLGLPFGYPNTQYMAFDLNAAGDALSVINLTGTNSCTVSVYGAFTAGIVVTEATSKANLQSLSYVVGYINADGQYYYNLAGNTMIQFTVPAGYYTAGDPIVSPNCPGGVVVFGPQALLKSQ
jgi:hypothetical protein